jgi:transposase
LQTLEKSRKFIDKELIALGNHIRAYLYEYGITFKRGVKSLREAIVVVLDDFDSELPKCLKTTLRILWERYQTTEIQLNEAEKARDALVKQLEPCKRLMDLEGVGNVCSAMLYANLGDGRDFKNGRQASVYIGLPPKQHSSGGKAVALRSVRSGSHLGAYWGMFGYFNVD